MVDNYDWYKRTVNVIQECNGMERAWDIYIHTYDFRKKIGSRVETRDGERGKLLNWSIHKSRRRTGTHR